MYQDTASLGWFVELAVVLLALVTIYDARKHKKIVAAVALTMFIVAVVNLFFMQTTYAGFAQ